MVRPLDIVARLSLPDCWIGAGLVRNAVGHDAWASAPYDDVDVVYFDPADPRAAAIEAGLRAAHPQTRWDVKNQTRMHRQNGDAPYLNTRDAIPRWPETATAVRRSAGGFELIAPHGTGDLLDLIACPTPAFVSRADIVARRIAEKSWQSRWPRLRVVECEDGMASTEGVLVFRRKNTKMNEGTISSFCSGTLGYRQGARK